MMVPLPSTPSSVLGPFNLITNVDFSFICLLFIFILNKTIKQIRSMFEY